jgi:hypothetical protein
VKIALAILAATTLGGCGEFMDGYNEARAHRGEPGYSQADYAARIGNELESGVGRFARGASNAYDDYQWSHATVTQQHGTMTGYVGGQSVWVNY